MIPALKSGPQIAAKTGNPAGLLLRRIWYSVGKSGVLGITEYRQGRPLYSLFIYSLFICMWLLFIIAVIKTLFLTSVLPAVFVMARLECYCETEMAIFAARTNLPVSDFQT